MTMTSFIKKVFRNGISKPYSDSSKQIPIPVHPPSPDLSHLTSEELTIIGDVLARQELFEAEEYNSLQKLQTEVEHYEELVRQYSLSKKGKIRHVDLRLCRLCYKTKFADGIGRLCFDCHKRVCHKCGAFTKAKLDSKRNRSSRRRWRCRMCLLKRELLCKTGKWYHDDKDKSKILNKRQLITCLSYDDESKSVVKEERRYSDSFILRESRLISSDHDGFGKSEDFNTESVQKNCHRTSHRRHSSAILTDVATVQEWADTEEQETDDEHFELERKLSRQKRQQQKSRRRSLRSAAVGEGEQNNSKVLLKQGSLSDTEQYLLGAESNTEFDEAYLMNLATKRSASTNLQTNNVRSRNHTDSRKSNMRSDDLGIRNYVTKDLTVSCNAMCSSRYAMPRQDALSYSSSSNSIGSDVKPSDQFSASTSPLSSRYYSDMSQSSLCPDDVPGSNRDQSPMSGRLKCASSIAPLFHSRSRRITLSQCHNININVEKTATSSATDMLNDAPPSNPHEVILHRDKQEISRRMGGFGMRVVGGKLKAGQDKLGAYVTAITEYGAADVQGNIRINDQILQWNGRSLIDTTFEEAREIMARPGDVIQLVVYHRPYIGAEEGEDAVNNPSPITRADSIDTACRMQTTSTKTNNSLYVQTPKRRMLPKTPIEIKNQSKRISGRVQVKLDFSAVNETLTVVVCKAEELFLTNSKEQSRVPSPLAIICLLPCRSSFSSHETESIQSTRDPVWDDTFVFGGLTFETTMQKSVEITIWDSSKSPVSELFLGEVLLDLNDANISGDPIWYKLEDHDENSSPLPLRNGAVSPSLPGSASHAAVEKTHSVRQSPILNSRSHLDASQPASFNGLKQRLSLGREPSESLPNSGTSTPSPRMSPKVSPKLEAGKLINGRAGSFSNKVRMKVSTAVMKVSSSLSKADKSSLAAKGEHPATMSRSKSITDLHRVTTNLEAPIYSNRRATIQSDLLSPPQPVRRAHSACSMGGETESDFDDDTCLQCISNCPTPEKTMSDVDDNVCTLGPGQRSPKSLGGIDPKGEIKVGFMVSKGELEVHIMGARGLVKNGISIVCDTYVKTYLMEGNKVIQKKKTRVCKASSEPMYRQKITYTACNIHGRYMKVNVWEKQKVFEKKSCLGEVVVKLDTLDLSQLALSYYTLFAISAAELGSDDSLSLWG